MKKTLKNSKVRALMIMSLSLVLALAMLAAGTICYLDLSDAVEHMGRIQKIVTPQKREYEKIYKLFKDKVTTELAEE